MELALVQKVHSDIRGDAVPVEVTESPEVAQSAQRYTYESPRVWQGVPRGSG